MRMLLPALVLVGCPLPDQVDPGAAATAGEDEVDPSHPPNLSTGWPNDPFGLPWYHDPRLAGCELTLQTDDGDHGDTLTYDAEGRVVSAVSWSPDGSTGYDLTWDETDCVAEGAYRDGQVRWTTTCDDFGNPTHMTYVIGAQSQESVASYTYDAWNRPITATTQWEEETPSTWTYTWDGLWFTDSYSTTDDPDDPLPGSRGYSTNRDDGRMEEWHSQVCGRGGVETCVDMRHRTIDFDDEGRVLGFTEVEYTAQVVGSGDPTNTFVEERRAEATQGDDPRVPARFDYVVGGPQGEVQQVFTLACE